MASELEGGYQPPVPADRHRRLFLDVKFPRSPNYYQRSRDKPYYVRCARSGAVGVDFVRCW